MALGIHLVVTSMLTSKGPLFRLKMDKALFLEALNKKMQKK